MLAFGKASAAGSLRLANKPTRLYSTAPAVALPKSNGTPADAATQRELFLNVLNANATKRDAKQYLARFKPAKHKEAESAKRLPLSRLQEERNARHRRDQDRLERIGVNLGGLYAPARAIAESPQFTREYVEEKAGTATQQKTHVSLVCLNAPETLDDVTLDGVALTLSQLVKLDMRILILLDCGIPSHDSKDLVKSAQGVKRVFAEQGERLIKAIAKHSPEGARQVTGSIEVSDKDPPDPQDAHVNLTSVSVGLPKTLLDPLKRSVIPIVPTLAYTPSGRLLHAPASSVMPALSAMLAGLSPTTGLSQDGEPTHNTSLDRIIVLDNAGGIPSKARGDGAHVFINLEQEFNDIGAELAEYGHACVSNKKGPNVPNVYGQHQANLSMLQKCLASLPSPSSALIITPQEAASSSQTVTADDSTIGTGTRRQKNTLIHNLLTNKPMVSSSLPVARLPSLATTNTTLAKPTSTIVKRGMPLTIIPAPDRGLGWQPPPTGTTTLSLETDPRVDFPRLLHLIEDSFRRKLDVNHYLHRIRHRLAGLIIAGSYEGAAILTWEQPPHTTSPTHFVPYLDKFAVLSSSQGSAGVADILFQAMVRTCFPQGVCWRSREGNPVNKWYFERCEGSWRLPGGGWRMFWTGEGVVREGRFGDFVGVCGGLVPSWKDGGRLD